MVRKDEAVILRLPYQFFSEDLSQYGMSATFVDSIDVSAIECAVKESTQMLFFEGLINPLSKVVPIDRLVRLAKRHGCRVVIDNTLSGPGQLFALDAGADVVVCQPVSKI